MQIRSYIEGNDSLFSVCTNAVLLYADCKLNMITYTAASCNYILQTSLSDILQTSLSDHLFSI